MYMCVCVWLGNIYLAIVCRSRVFDQDPILVLQGLRIKIMNFRYSF